MNTFPGFTQNAMHASGAAATRVPVRVDGWNLVRMWAEISTPSAIRNFYTPSESTIVRSLSVTLYFHFYECVGTRVLIHSLLGKLKPGDIPAHVRSRASAALIENYFVKDTVVPAGYPLDMRYAGPREALLHAVFRQNYGCSHQIIGRDHAGVGDYYGPFDAHHIFEEIPEDALEIQPLKIDWTFWCYKCEAMASMKTCPHDSVDRLLLSGTKLRRMLSDDSDVPVYFSRPEVLAILREYYAGLQDEEKVEIVMHGHSAR